MPNIFVVSDTWFNRLREDDQNITVVNNNEFIITNWNEAIGKDDKVYVLGGFGIGDLYHILVRLNGEIHFLNNYFNDDEKSFIKEMKDATEKSSDSNFKNRIFFENNQIEVIKDMDAVLSYLPLEDWPGKNTGTYCFHGLTNKMDLEGHNISCTGEQWDYMPISISEVQDNIQSFTTKF
jgi:calcineurin-like phosphoesterase family protein